MFLENIDLQIVGQLENFGVDDIGEQFDRGAVSGDAHERLFPVADAHQITVRFMAVGAAGKDRIPEKRLGAVGAADDQRGGQTVCLFPLIFQLVPGLIIDEIAVFGNEDIVACGIFFHDFAGACHIFAQQKSRVARGRLVRSDPARLRITVQSQPVRPPARARTQDRFRVSILMPGIDVAGTHGGQSGLRLIPEDLIGCGLEDIHKTVEQRPVDIIAADVLRIFLFEIGAETVGGIQFAADFDQIHIFSVTFHGVGHECAPSGQ